MNENLQRTAFVAIVGCPNVGKSSILNKILGVKIAIVSSKPQTTRNRIMGVFTEGDLQLVFTDTPGYHRAHNKLDEVMAKSVVDSIGGVDACILVVEPEGELRPAEQALIEKFKAENLPVILAINKIDTIKDKTVLFKRVEQMSQHYDFCAVTPISAQTGQGMKELMLELERLAQPSFHFFPEDTLTDQPERVIAAEIIREKMLRLLNYEIPHGTAVVIEKMRERASSEIMDIEATIYCEKETHKGIIIGKSGSMLKKISTYARQDMEKFFGTHINLRCFVKVKDGWRNNNYLIKNFGLTDE